MELMDKIRGKIKTTEKKLKTAKKASADHKKQMMVSQYLAGFGNAGLRSQRNLANEL